MIGVGTHEDRTRNAVTGVYRGARSIPALRRDGGFRAGRAALKACAPRTCIPQESGSEPESAWAEAKGHTFRFPRPCRFLGQHLSGLAGEFLVGDPLANDPRDGQIEAVPVVHLASIVVRSEEHT